MCALWHVCPPTQIKKYNREFKWTDFIISDIKKSELFMGKASKNNTKSADRLTPISLLEGAEAFTLLLAPQLVLLTQER